jgi:hypothetical protein
MISARSSIDVMAAGGRRGAGAAAKRRRPGRAAGPAAQPHGRAADRGAAEAAGRCFRGGPSARVRDHPADHHARPGGHGDGLAAGTAAKAATGRFEGVRPGRRGGKSRVGAGSGFQAAFLAPLRAIPREVRARMPRQAPTGLRDADRPAADLGLGHPAAGSAQERPLRPWRTPCVRRPRAAHSRPARQACTCCRSAPRHR